MHHGTIIFAARRRRFVLLAADQLYHGSGGSFLEPKIVLHPDLPAAVGCAGLHALPIGGRRVVDQVREVLKRFATPRALTMEALRARLEKRLAGHARAAHLREGDPSLKGKTRCELHLAIVLGGVAHLGQLSMTDRVDFTAHDHQVVSGPPDLVQRLMMEHEPHGREYLGENLEDPDQLAACMLEVMAEGIGIDGEIRGEDARECGGPVDLVVVDRYGARPYGSPG
jgi:hypothetical protein